MNPNLPPITLELDQADGIIVRVQEGVRGTTDLDWEWEIIFALQLGRRAIEELKGWRELNEVSNTRNT